MSPYSASRSVLIRGIGPGIDSGAHAPASRLDGPASAHSDERRLLLALSRGSRFLARGRPGQGRAPSGTGGDGLSGSRGSLGIQPAVARGIPRP
jgi:hypothetical protein